MLPRDFSRGGLQRRVFGLIAFLRDLAARFQRLVRHVPGLLANRLLHKQPGQLQPEVHALGFDLGEFRAPLGIGLLSINQSPHLAGDLGQTRRRLGRNIIRPLGFLGGGFLAVCVRPSGHLDLRAAYEGEKI